MKTPNPESNVTSLRTTTSSDNKTANNVNDQREGDGAPVNNEPDLNAPELFINRELSLLEFNRRVQAQVKDPQIPLLERLRYLSISTTILDEFFEVRVAGLKQKAEIGMSGTGPDNMSAQETLNAIATIVRDLVTQQYSLLNDEILPALAKENILFIRRSDWSKAQDKWLHDYFEEAVLPVLSPMGLDPAHPFPRILNKSLCFIVSLTGKDAFGRDSGLAVVQVPRSLPRLIQLPSDIEGNGPHDYVFLSSIIHAYVDEIFHGMKVEGMYQFKVTRNSELYVNSEEVGDLARALEGELFARRYGDVVRLEIDNNCPQEIVAFLSKTLCLQPQDIYFVDGPVNINRMMQVCNMDDRTDLKFKSYVPSIPSKLKGNVDLFQIIAKKDILVYHPYESFLPVVDFLKQAANDPKVLAIKQTLYRTGPDSAVVDALVDAARKGKEVTVVIEIRARFDEAENIALANRLHEVGAQVAYGVVGYKTHVKMIIVVRREQTELQHYVHLSTGNYHPGTTRLYTDYGLFTRDKAIGEDVHKVFIQLTSLGKVSKLQKCFQAPFNLHSSLLGLIERETNFAKQGKEARIIAKMNAITEKTVIQALYRASIAGVKVQLIVRGVCRLRPGVPGISDNISVISIVGRFLEHNRVCYFHNDDNVEIYCSSADWMDRNFHQRVELMYPIENKSLKAIIIRHLQFHLSDNQKAWELGTDGQYKRVEAAEGVAPCNSQEQLMLEYTT